MYDVELSKIAEKQLYKLNKDLQIRIISTLERCRVRPYVHVKKLVSSSYFRLRVGKYRIIIDIIQNKLIVFVIKIEHRKKIYKH
tara:strand:- start:367 stop:618 length:252 start_codon:yes stop_codon:yes gene_type:complete